MKAQPNAAFEFLGWDLLVLCLEAALLLGLLLALRWVLVLVPMRRSRRDLLARAGPMATAVVAFLFLAAGARRILGSTSAYFPLALGALMLIFVAASWSAIRDALSGVFVRAGRTCRVGDLVRIGEIQGRVQRMGLRSLTLETSDGDEAVIPYSTVAQSAIVRTASGDRLALHVFRVDVPEGLSLAQARRLIQQRALGVHWACIAREPQVHFLGERRFEVTVYALDPDRAPEIEAAVRRDPALRRDGTSGSSGAAAPKATGR